jgi:hypothetical protein
MSRDRYRENAAECLHLADQVNSADSFIRTGLIEMAHAWLELAEAAQNRSDDFKDVYEPKPSLRLQSPHNADT